MGHPFVICPLPTHTHTTIINRLGQAPTKTKKVGAAAEDDNRRSDEGLELVTQRELHYARAGEQAGVVAERARVRNREGRGLHVKPVQV